MPILALDVLGIHTWFAWVFVGTNAVAGAWALAAHWWEPARTPWLWRFTALAWCTVAVQVGLGAYLMGSEERTPAELHDLYGYSGVFAIAIVYSYGKQMRVGRTDAPPAGLSKYLLYGLGSLFIMGLGIRAMTLRI
jgi:hypothetical protein